ncbi:MAG: pta 3 [Firmicutes bacterium]|nr:pta 3 [Bacillota bacterium]
MSYKNFGHLIEHLSIDSNKRKVAAVMAAEDRHTLEAVCQARRVGIIEPLLIGNKARIKRQLTILNEQASDYPIVNVETTEGIVLAAARMISDGKAHFLMKGLLQTGEMMKILLSEQAGFRTETQMTHLSIVEIPAYHKLFGLTDAALSVAPDLAQKKIILENAINTMRLMGFDRLKVAILSAVEQVNPKMQDTVDADALKKMNFQGNFTDCIIEGPISYDLAISKQAAELKGYESPVCGDVDLLVVPNLVTGNVLLKALRYSAQAISAGIVIGGKAPLVLTSRAAEAESKYLPIILAAAASA